MSALAQGVCVTLYGGSRPDRVLTDDVRALLAHVLPGIVCVHGGPRALRGEDPDEPRNAGAASVIAAVRELVPGVAVWIGVGCDGWTSAYAAGRRAEALAWLERAAEFAAVQGAAALVWDAEAASEAAPKPAAELAPRLIRGVATTHPGVVQGVTSYGVPTLHARFPWAAWHTIVRDARSAPVGGVRFTVPQVYAAPESGGRAARGALAARCAASERAMWTAVQRGWVPADVEVRRYLQAHGIAADESVAAARGASSVCFWAAPNEIDADGREAIVRVCDARRGGRTA